MPCLEHFGLLCIRQYNVVGVLVSKAMSRCETDLPWFRVVKSNRTLAFKKGGDAYKKQVYFLEKEGTKIINGKVIPANIDSPKDLDKLLWR